MLQALMGGDPDGRTVIEDLGRRIPTKIMREESQRKGVSIESIEPTKAITEGQEQPISRKAEENRRSLHGRSSIRGFGGDHVGFRRKVVNSMDG